VLKRLLLSLNAVALLVAVAGCGTAPPTPTTARVAAPAPAASPSPSTTAPVSSRVTVPSLKGKTATGATWRLERLGLKAKVKWVRSSAPRGRVIGQRPSGGEADTGSTIALTISSGPKGSQSGASQTSAGSSSSSDKVLARLFQQQKSGVQVTGEGTVDKVLADDNDGGRHQRFILRLGSGQTLLMAHNIDIAPRLPSLSAGERVGFKGVYEWNSQGGVVHWTHHDPGGQHPTGWLSYAGSTYK